MNRDDDVALDDILSRWHHWQLGARVGRGHADRSLVAGDYRTSRQYDDVNGALDDDLEAATMRTVQSQVDNMVAPWKIAVYVIARNAYLGTSAFASPRLPSEPKARGQVIDEARRMILTRLRSAGVL